MLAVPSALQSKFDERLRIRSIPDNLHGPYQKWLRYYLDFCQKYHSPPKHDLRVRRFLLIEALQRFYGSSGAFAPKGPIGPVSSPPHTRP